jgi:hypothetical protein
MTRAKIRPGFYKFGLTLHSCRRHQRVGASARSTCMENESTFVAPEGVYSVTEELKPSPPHTPSASHIFPTRLSYVVITFPAPKQTGPGFAQLLGGNKENKKEKDRDKDKDKDKAQKTEDGVSQSSSETPDEGSADQPALALDTIPNNPSIPHLFSQSLAPGKKKSASRPKHNIRTTSSTFITRLQCAEGLTKILQSKHGEMTFLFYNLAKTFFWVETGSKSKVRVYRVRIDCLTVREQEPLARVSFSAYPTCHDVNVLTACSERIDIIIGFNTGDLIWFGEYYACLRSKSLTEASFRPDLLTVQPFEQRGARSPHFPLPFPDSIPSHRVALRTLDVQLSAGYLRPRRYSLSRTQMALLLSTIKSVTMEFSHHKILHKLQTTTPTRRQLPRIQHR